MKPELRFVVPCSCGARNHFAHAQAGTRETCPVCSTEFAVPGLRELKQFDTVDISPIGKLAHRIETREAPFIGICQLCNTYEGTSLVRTLVRAASREQQYEIAINIPCIFCDACTKDFTTGMWSGRLQSLINAFLGLIWLLIALLIAAVIAFLFPLLGITAVVAFMTAMVYQLMCKRSNPFLLRHLDRICNLKGILKQADEYLVTSERIMTVRVEDNPLRSKGTTP